jgi:hypothetical protein
MTSVCEYGPHNFKGVSLMQRLFKTADSKMEAENTATEKLDVQYVSYDQIHPGQIRYSKLNTAEKVGKLKKKKAAIFIEDSKSYEYKYHKGTSVLSKKDALPVVKTNFGYVLTDGHHDVMSSLELKAKMIPIKITDDLSHLSKDAFWKLAEEKGLAYLVNINGDNGLPPASFADLIDDSNRYFAAITARKYIDEKNGTFNSKGADYPLWIKINKDIPFIEFKIANALFAKGFVYEPTKMGNPPRQEVIEQARQILREAKIVGLRLVTEVTHYQVIKVDFKACTFKLEPQDEKPSLKH